MYMDWIMRDLYGKVLVLKYSCLDGHGEREREREREEMIVERCMYVHMSKEVWPASINNPSIM